LAKFVDIICYSSTRTPLILCVIAPNINYQRSKLGYWNKITSTLRHSSSSLQKYQAARWKRVKHTHRCVKSNSQLQNEATLMSRQSSNTSSRA